MIYLVSAQQKLFESTEYKQLSIEDSLAMINSWGIIQYDSETGGRDCHLCDLLCAQFGNDAADARIVVDCTTVDIKLYKEALETKWVIGQNLKFDLQFLYNYGIIPRKVYDTMIVEQLLHLGYPSGIISYALNAIAERRLGVNIDKTVRGEIIWRGLDERVIIYAAGDVTYLEKIMRSQLEDCRKKDCLIGARLECDFVPVIAYLEWCGIKLDEDKWKAKMDKDSKCLQSAKMALDKFVTSNPKLNKYYYVNNQGDLFGGFNTDPICSINWSSSRQVVQLAKELGFDTTVQDKKTGEDKDSVLEKHLKGQKGINDEFLKLYFDYQEYAKVVSSFGQGHLDAINPKTGRIHTVYRQLGTISGRMSCGSQQPNTDLAKFKQIPAKRCTSPNMQQLPHDAVTRSCFVSEPNNVFVSVDWSAMEARIGAEVYNEKTLLDEFLYGSGDSHAAYAKAVFKEELKGIDVKDVKRLRPDLRNKVKSIEFAVQFGSDGTAAAPQLGVSVDEAKQLVTNLLEGMTGLASFKTMAGKQLMEKGYVLISPQTGHKAYWWDYEAWKERQKSFTSEFWEEYKKHKGTGDTICQTVRHHFQAVSKWRDRMSLNLPTQGGGAICLKDACITLFNWIVDNGYFNKIKLVNLTHDEINSECPKELQDTYPQLVADIMQKTCAKYYTKLSIPAEASVNTHWVH